MTRRLLFVVLFLGLYLAPRAGQAQIRPATTPPADGVIHGTVLGQHGSEVSPLPNAIVSFLSGSQYFIVTADSRGNYKLEGLPPGSWRVKAIHVGYNPVSASVQVPVGGAVLLDLCVNFVTNRNAVGGLAQLG